MSKKIVVGQGGRNCRNEIARYLRNQCEGQTSYKIARKIGYTPQWVNKKLKEMWAGGFIVYRIVETGRGEKREWIFGYDEDGRKVKGDEWVFAYEEKLL